MDTSLNKWTLLALVMATAPLHAEELPDPTAPAIAAGAVQTGTAPVPSEEGLRTIIVSPDQRYAVIDGRQVLLGGRVGQERLEAVCEDRVVLAGAAGRHEVLIYPDVKISGRESLRCMTAQAEPMATNEPAPVRKLDKITHKKPRPRAGKKEKVCK